MARTDNLTNFLTDVAAAIKTKKEITEQIPAANFDQEILGITTGVDTSDATATVNDIIRGKTAYIKDGKVTGVLKGARYYDTEEEMYADTNVEPVTYGLVYREKDEAWTPTSGTAYMKFPETVVLPEALTESLRARLFGITEDGEHVDIDMYMSSTGGQIMSFGGGEFNLYYNTDDGITYTRQGPAEKDWGAVTAWDNMEGEWNDTWSYFIRTVVGEQGGLYKYDYATQVDGYYGYNPINDSNSEQSFIFPEGYYGRDRGGHPIIIFPEDWVYDITKKGNVLSRWYEFDPYNDGSELDCGSPTAPIGILKYTDGKYYYCCCQYKSSAKDAIVKRTYTVNADGTVTYTDSKQDLIALYGKTETSNQVYYKGPEITNTDWVIAQVYYNQIKIFTFSNNTFVEDKTIPCENASVPMYTMTKNQFTLLEPNQLLPGVVAFGKTKTVTGDGSIYDNLDKTNISDSFLGIGDLHQSSNAPMFNRNTLIGRKGDNSVPYGKISYFKYCDIYDEPDITEYAPQDDTMIDNESWLWEKALLSEHIIDTKIYSSDKTYLYVFSTFLYNPSYMPNDGRIQCFNRVTKELVKTITIGLSIGATADACYYVKNGDIYDDDLTSDRKIYKLTYDTMEETEIGEIPKLTERTFNSYQKYICSIVGDYALIGRRCWSKIITILCCC